MNKEIWLHKKRKIPRNVYVLMTLMGLYLFYIVSRIVEGLQEPEITGKAAIYVFIGLLTIIGIAFISEGIVTLVHKDFREFHEEKDEDSE